MIATASMWLAFGYASGKGAEMRVPGITILVCATVDIAGYVLLYGALTGGFMTALP